MADTCHQAIGRVRRYGQARPVHIWRFLASSTIDTEIYDQRLGKREE
jgi:SNF2 family DNA or RNA helicase